MIPSTHTLRPAASTYNALPLLYHGGPVQHSSTAYAIVWVPASYSVPAGYTSLISQYFTDVAHDSYRVSNVYATDTQYSDVVSGVKQFVSYSSAYGGTIIDTDPLPSNGCPDYRLADGSISQNCITDAQIETEVSAVAARHHLPAGLGAEYFLFTPAGLASCGDAYGLVTGNCYAPFAYNGYCAYHSSTSANASAVLYADIPYAAFPGCFSGVSPNNNPGDAVVSTASHEQNETITDPLGNAWFDLGGSEIADKCATSFGSPIGATAWAAVNQVINGHPYWLQREWSNRSRSCVQRNTYPQPVASIVISSAKPPRGTKVTFTAVAHDGDDTTFSYRWTFSNAGATTRSVIHVFPHAGVKRITLVITDPNGDQARVSKTLSVT